ncbi:hypothetical protein DPQ33_10750 [Oceanidesulfovibrio indonesiensis]|uniref:STAS domain-containing protein n=1 Tax=Oceanidesulfovibrio indonesiensis TaxID=54767 RepID=A0A7M3MEW5_9BACT|nr:STAS domain-containing protein [Oceanidesulfovibrio indonesiensis]TVM16884.1 hypothetical protein DPQ33_10750 [Oceanidesulfovibrio indonesiensis]
MWRTPGRTSRISRPICWTSRKGGAAFDSELVTRIFRTAHAIKGSASLLGLDKVRELAHRVENVLDMVRSNEMEPTRAVAEAVVASLDRIAELVDDIAASESADTEALVSALTSLVSASLPPERHASLAKTRRVVLPDDRVAFEIPEHDLIQARKGGNFLYLVEYDLIADVHRKHKTPLDLLNFLEKSGLLLDCKMDIAAVGTLDDEITRRIPLYVLYATILEEDLVRAVFQVDSRYIHIVERDEKSGVEKAWPLAPRERVRPMATTTFDKDALDSMEAAFDESLARMGAATATAQEHNDMETELAPNVSGSDAAVALTGRLTIERAAEIKEMFAQALDAGDDVTVDLSRVEDADVTFLQVLWAAYKSAGQRGVRISLSGEIPEGLKEAAARAGLADLTPETQVQPDFPLLGRAVEG